MELLKPNIIHINDVKFVGIKYYGKNRNNEINNLWIQFLSRINQIQNRCTSSYYGICEIIPGSNKYTYLCCVKVDSSSNIPNDMTFKTFPSSLYAAFQFKGSLNNLGQIYEYIYGHWLPHSSFKHTNLPDIQVFSKLGTLNEEILIKLLIPIE